MPTYTLEEITALGWLSPEEAETLRSGLAHAEENLIEFEQRFASLQANMVTQTQSLQNLMRDHQMLRARLDLLEGGEFKH